MDTTATSHWKSRRKALMLSAIFLLCAAVCSVHAGCMQYKPGTSGAAAWQTPTRPMIVLPGIAGSRLQSAPVQSPGDTSQVWLNIETSDDGCDSSPDPWGYDTQGSDASDCTAPRFLFCTYNSSTKYCERPNQASQLVFADLDNSGLCGCDDLDPEFYVPTHADWYVRWWFEYAAGTLGYQEGKTMWARPYDWRQSNGNEYMMNELFMMVKNLSDSSGQKVDLISHSMGGLLTRSFVSYWKDALVPYVHSWIAIAAPFRGAGKVSNGFVEGYNGGLNPVLFVHGLTNHTAHSCELQWPSMYEMLPDPTWHWQKPDGPPTITLLVDGIPAAEFSSYHAEYLHFIKEVNADNFFIYDYDNVNHNYSNTFSDALWSDTQELWDQWRNQTTLPFSFYSIAGGATPTPHNLTYFLNSSSLWHTMVGEAPEIVAGVGDGTVPVESALSDGYDNAIKRVELMLPSIQHMYMFSEPVVRNILRRFLGASCVWDGTFVSTVVADITFPRGWGVAPNYEGVSDWANGTNEFGESYNLTISSDCLTLTGTYNGVSTSFNRVVGHECLPGEWQMCKFGIQLCVYGNWGLCDTEQAQAAWRGAPADVPSPPPPKQPVRVRRPGEPRAPGTVQKCEFAEPLVYAPG